MLVFEIHSNAHDNILYESMNYDVALDELDGFIYDYPNEKFCIKRVILT